MNMVVIIFVTKRMEYFATETIKNNYNRCKKKFVL